MDEELLPAGKKVLMDECEYLKKQVLDVIANSPIEQTIKNFFDTNNITGIDDIADVIRNFAQGDERIFKAIAPLYTYSYINKAASSITFDGQPSNDEIMKEKFLIARRSLIYNHVHSHMKVNMKGEQTLSFEARCAAIGLY